MEPIKPIGFVRGGRERVFEDGWGPVVSRIELDPAVFDESATMGLDDYSHVEVVFAFHLATRTCTGTQHPRGNTAWPPSGILAQRAPNRPNHLGVSVCGLAGVDGLTLTVHGLDALDGSPVLDVKPYLPEFGPRGEVRGPAWSRELMRDYF
ncbi:SAM-dependent methyltransferase [Paractinoplanes lichenicola]|uniref:SAM-dependent methyltransferase n=1 Tax=Paractinoplanes lichenicola TaxID=2802976 RepID=A0ABS1VFJ1_9ACTN|nr:SAM-dependent methyltransferase [Actinoplanes lichenicola]MBL7253385.1 SAM-dependent methyltransferase [Actinoplanes lichenicola]